MLLLSIHGRFVNFNLQIERSLMVCLKCQIFEDFSI